MSCTPEQISEKRRIALERLNIRKLRMSTADQSPTATPSVNQNSSSAATSPKSVASFYGNEKNVKTDVLNDYENKIKKSPANKITNRILSQPYPNNNNSGPSTSGASPGPKLASVFTKVVSCSCSMATPSRFQVTTSGFCAKLVDIFRTIPSKAYDTSTRIWSFGVNDYELVQEKVNLLNPDVVIAGLPKFVLNLMREKKKPEIDLLRLQKIEPHLRDQLLDFQKYGVAFGISTSGRCMIADDMGLGKTYQALAIANYYKDDFPLLICTTATARESWAQHIRSLLPDIPPESIVCWQSTQEYIGNVKVLVTSYSLMDKNCDRLCEKNFGILILDESHTIKNFKAKTTSSACRLGEKAKRVILLTGTPALSRPVELYCQLNLIDKRFFGNFREYGLRYCAGKETTFGFDCNGQSNLQELNLILRQKFMIRRTKEDVEFELGTKSRETITLDPDKVWSTNDLNIHEAAKNVKIYSNDFLKSRGEQREELLLRFYSETAKLKAKAVRGYIKKIIPDKIKFIVFAYHKVMLDAISDCLTKQKVDFIRIDGTTKSDLRNKYIDRFQNQKSCQVALLSLKACNAAITLTSASLVVFSELYWNPSTLAQCESRAHRIGQKGPVTCRYLLAKGTADDVIWEMLKRKQEVLNKAGIFSEDLADATHTADPISNSNTLTQYFQPLLAPSKNECNMNSATETAGTEQEEVPNKEHEAYKDMLDDEDDMFMDLDY
ncbi:SWI/SNF-related matrix-associated actin-dependent regulator of chromatin subfamily A-like protein 1 [Bradysia coprophila]|uniref:SWI/SNF-related matrix-associated actin-dependent regulator of chromatin subfamily A-like protein 1 n=1 Tax=Bradysia coprophila TaxID=38358 RepID=UPI00187D7C40|nr:SWI/SNF-related matrix-associated actin-dependent regulator of chromatin subfamily A-like protein 1 [Bradysia coprophila]